MKLRAGPAYVVARSWSFGIGTLWRIYIAPTSDEIENGSATLWGWDWVWK